MNGHSLLLPTPLRKLRPCTTHIRLLPLTTPLNLPNITLHLLTILPPRLTLLKVLGKLFSRARLGGNTSSRDTRSRVGNSDEEVRGGLPIRRLVPHLLEISQGFIRRSEIREAPRVDDAYFVEMLVEGLAGLVDGDDGGEAHGVGGDSEGLNEFEGC